MQPCVLGVDGGGTKTFAALATRDGDVVAWHVASDTNPLDQPRWRDNLAEAINSVANGSVVFAALGLPVHDEIQAVAAEQTALVRRLLSAPAVLRNDVHTAHEGAFAGG